MKALAATLFVLTASLASAQTTTPCTLGSEGLIQLGENLENRIVYTRSAGHISSVELDQDTTDVNVSLKHVLASWRDCSIVWTANLLVLAKDLEVVSTTPTDARLSWDAEVTFEVRLHHLHDESKRPTQTKEYLRYALERSETQHYRAVIEIKVFENSTDTEPLYTTVGDRSGRYHVPVTLILDVGLHEQQPSWGRS